MGSGWSSSSGGALGCSGGLVVLGGVEDELAEEFSGGGVDHADVEFVDEQDDVGSGVGSADADVVQSAGDAQGDAAAVVDAVVADPVVGVGVAAGGGLGLGQAGVEGRWGGPVRQGPVRSVVVVLGGERVEQGLQLGEGAGLDGLGGEPLLEGLLEAFDLAAGGGVVGAGVLLGHAEALEFGFQGVAAALAAGQAGGEHHPVVGQGGRGGAVAGGGGAERGKDDRAGDRGVGGHRHCVAGAVVQPGQDLGVGAGVPLGWVRR